MPFHFLDPGPLIDRELELIAPHEKWIDALLESCAHPLSQSDDRCRRTTRQGELEYLKTLKHGGQLGDSRREPSYHFWMRLLPQYNPLIPIAGGLSLRIGDSRDLEMFIGHLGYHVHPPARGNHYAERACRLLFPLATAHGIRMIWITCNPENAASRRTCERLGGVYIDTVKLPTDHALYHAGEREKCRYRIDLANV